MSDIVLLFLYVPVITGLIGWGTNWAAVKMIFWPAHFRGLGPLGWQGILYKQAHKFATNVADMATNNLLTARELVDRVDPDELEALLADTTDAQARELCAEAADVVQPGAWAQLSEPVKNMVTTQVKLRTRDITRSVWRELEKRADDLIDLHALVYTQLSGENVGRLAQFTRRIGRKEFKFIEYYGGVFGFAIGLVQIGVWSVMQTWWLMPIIGAIVGLVTNWLAIEMIFRPHQPTTYLGVIRYQGMFPKRQAEIAADYGDVAGKELLTPRNLLAFITEGERGARIAAVVTEILQVRIDDEWRKIKPLIPVPVSDQALASIKARITERILRLAPLIQPRIEAYLASRLQVAATVEARLSSLSKPEFERILRGIFEEDERTLILVGGMLGATVGMAQGMLVLAL